MTISSDSNIASSDPENLPTASSVDSHFPPQPLEGGLFFGKGATNIRPVQAPITIPFTGANAAQQPLNSTNATSNANTAHFTPGMTAAFNMLQQQMTDPNSQIRHMMTLQFSSDGRVIPDKGNGTEHIALKDVKLQKPSTLPNVDSNIWHDFATRMTPIASLVRKSFMCYAVIGVLYLLSFALFPIVFATDVMGSRSVLVSVVFVITGTIIFYGGCFFGRRQKKMIDDEVNAICNEFDQRFRSNDHKLDYFSERWMIVISPLPATGSDGV
jgi:hypothetical protein